MRSDYPAETAPVRLPPRLMLTAPASGSGKTMITCGLLTLLKARGTDCRSFKCGPDYIDPMFHRAVLGIPSGNLDPFFSPGEAIARLFAAQAGSCQLAILEGAMGYYDGLGGISTRASAYDTACLTGTPAVMILNGSGLSVTAAALLKGLKGFRSPSHIAGVILNQVSEGYYSRMERMIREETGLRVMGYLPKLPECSFASRHL